MSKMTFTKILVFILLTFSFVKCSSIEAIDTNLLENVLDAEECRRQIRTIRRNFALGMQFSDAGIKTPRGILTGNLVDLGNYHQCLAIDHQRDDMHIQGKYCSIRVPLDQTFRLPRSHEQQEWTTFNPATLRVDKDTIKQIEEYNLYRSQIMALTGDFSSLENARSFPSNPIPDAVFTLGVCVPKPCTTEQAITSLIFNITAIGFNYTDNYCRLRDDKPWSGADTAAVVVFSVIGFITLLSTCYDILFRFVFKNDIKKVNPYYQSCSLYTNGQRLMKFNSGPGTLNCMDGMRAISMIWVIIGHSFSTEPFVANPLDSTMWLFSASSLWITVATASVDTFFTMAGILLVYSTAGKMNGRTLLKNLHWFYLGRIVRIVPLLAVTVLLQASYMNHMADGPVWTSVEHLTNMCRQNWWSTLLNIQNLYNTTTMCVAQSWYIAIDIQLYIISPLVLFWVLGGKRRTAWLALVTALAAVLIASTIYSFNLNLQAGTIVPARPRDEYFDYMINYYFHTLSRASPFFVGLIFGYILHIYRGQKVKFSWIYYILIWTVFGTISACIVYFKYNIVTTFDWDNQLLDNIMNSFMRPAWAVAIGLVIFACVHGYGGPVNWLLSLSIWQLPARLSYGMFLFHYPLMFSINATMIVPIYFSVGLFTFKFLSYLGLSILVSFFFTLLIDSPISVLYRQLMLSVQKKKPVSPDARKTTVQENANQKTNDVAEKCPEENKIEIVESKEDLPAVTIK